MPSFETTTRLCLPWLAFERRIVSFWNHAQADGVNHREYPKVLLRWNAAQRKEVNPQFCTTRLERERLSKQKLLKWRLFFSLYLYPFYCILLLSKMKLHLTFLALLPFIWTTDASMILRRDGTKVCSSLGCAKGKSNNGAVRFTLPFAQVSSSALLILSQKFGSHSPTRTYSDRTSSLSNSLLLEVYVSQIQSQLANSTALTMQPKLPLLVFKTDTH